MPLPSAPWHASQAAAFFLPAAALSLADAVPKLSASAAARRETRMVRCCMVDPPSILVQLLGREAGQVRRDVLDLLFGQAVRLRVHRRVLARVVLVFVEGVDEVLLVLPGDARHVVFGGHRFISGDAVTTVAGIHVLLALGRITLGEGGGRETRESSHQ